MTNSLLCLSISDGHHHHPLTPHLGLMVGCDMTIDLGRNTSIHLTTIQL